jgi:membrane dipeptidase
MSRVVGLQRKGRAKAEREAPTARPLVFDGLNCAALDAEQMTTTLRGHVSAINWTAIRPSARLADALLDINGAWERAEGMRDVAAIVTSVAGIEAAHRSGRVGVVLGAQNSLMFEDSLGHIGVFKRLGLRIVQPTYNEKNAFGHGANAIGGKDRGITEPGRAWVAEMHRQRLLIDLSHCGHKTSLGFLAEARRPVVFSHANAYAVCPSPRNKTDEMIRKVAATGGLIGAVMWSPAVSHATRPTLDDYLTHVLHLVATAGIEHVGFASDVSERVLEDPVDWERNWGPKGLYPAITGMCGDWYRFATRHNLHFDSLAHTPRIWDGLRRRGLKPAGIERIMSGNWLRVLRDVWGE